MPSYHGSCHCASIRFAMTLPKPITETSFVTCNCSICSMRGNIAVWLKPEQIELITPLEECTLYEWNTMTAKDYFCPKCGMLPYRRPRTNRSEEWWVVNARCSEGVDLDALESNIKKVSGTGLSGERPKVKA